MSTLKVILAFPLACLAFAGCTTTQTPIIAGAVDTVGVSVGAGAQEQGANLVVGYRGAKFAVVPVENRNGELLLIRDANGGQKGFSVFAMLGLDVKGSTAPCVGVAQVVAVGPAAEAWAAKAATTGPGC